MTPLDDDRGRKLRVGDLVILRVVVMAVVGDEANFRIMSSRIVDEGLTPRMVPVNLKPN